MVLYINVYTAFFKNKYCIGAKMYIKNLKLNGFRNLENLDLELSSGVNIFFGDNAQGKTNILESIYYCSLGKSHRTNKDKELIMWNSKNAFIKAYISRERLDKNIEIKIFEDGKKGIKINSIRINKILELLGVLNVIMFSPEDLKIVKESPSYRRHFIDIEICKLNSKYYYNLIQYNKVLTERNLLLKKFRNNASIKDMVDIYDEQLAEFGANIIKERVKYLNDLNKKGKVIHSSITSSNEDIDFNYITSVKKIENSYSELKELLSKSFEKDFERGITSYGPHRDDFSIKINGIDARSYGSQGQQRTSILTMKFASLEIVKDQIGEYPVLLLDDVLSELDLSRQKYILSSINKYQTIITCTGIENVNYDLYENASMFYVSKGKVEKRSWCIYMKIVNNYYKGVPWCFYI